LPPTPPDAEPAGRSGLAVYAEPRLAAIVAMGFASGLPLALTGATLGIWLTRAGVSLKSIGFFGLVGAAYSLKFLWAPLIDRVRLPVIGRLGQRRSWTLVLQSALILAILGLGASDPAVDPVATAAWAVAVAFLSASQDIVIDAFRVELLTPEEQGAGAAATQFGYRAGMIASGAGALYAASAFGWHAAYTVMAGLILVGSAAVLLAPEPAVERVKPRGDWLIATVVAPFADFARRPDWLAILVFVVLYNLGDAMAGHMAGSFYVKLGFSDVEIANVSKIFGVAAALAGVALGGIVVYRLGVLRALLVCGVAKLATNLLYLLQLAAGHDVAALALTIGAENVAGGLASAAFVAYLSRLCSPAYTATQYALLSALATLARTVLSSSGGAVAQAYGWAPFFLMSAALGVPSLVLLAWLMRRQSWISASSPSATTRPTTLT